MVVLEALVVDHFLELSKLFLFELLEDFPLVVNFLKFFAVFLNEDCTLATGEVDDVDTALVFEGVDQLIRHILEEHYIL